MSTACALWALEIEGGVETSKAAAAAAVVSIVGLERDSGTGVESCGGGAARDDKERAGVDDPAMDGAGRVAVEGEARIRVRVVADVTRDMRGEVMVAEEALCCM